MILVHLCFKDISVSQENDKESMHLQYLLEAKQGSVLVTTDGKKDSHGFVNHHWQWEA